MLSRAQIDGFQQQGVLRLPEAFPPSASQAMRAVLWDTLAKRHGVLEGDRATWDLRTATGLQRLRNHEAFKPLTGPAIRSALDELIAAGRWHQPRHAGSLLISFPPAPGTKSRPNFHTDFPYDLATDRVEGALVFAFLDAVPARAVVVCHPWLLHGPSPNRGTEPRFMAVQRIHTSQRPSAP